MIRARISLHSLVAVALLALGIGAAHATVPRHFYELNGSYADSLGGPALASFGGVLGATGYSFGANQGLAVDGAVNAGVYTIDTTFSFDVTSGYRKIIDFKGGTSDSGLYSLNTSLNFYPVIVGPIAAINAGAPVRVTITRDAADTFTGYVNGVQQISFNDSGSLAVFSANSAIFFRDDNNTSGREASAGSVDYIAIYDTALSAQEIATLVPTIPEPESYALMLAGLAILAGARAKAARRRHA